MKKLINKVDDVEREMIEGLAKAAPKKLRKLDEGNIIVRTPRKEGKVALVSGGGSGHEPAHGGYVGSGMLDCAVAGSVFTSPTPDQIYEGIKAVATEAGVLAIVKNYTGDVLNFEMAIDMAKDEGVNADYVIVNDDVAVKDSLYTTGRRGVAGTIFVHKIAGARAEEGASLAEVKACAEDVIQNVRSMGMAIAPCTVPAAGKHGFTLAEDEVEIGIGIHGEPGYSKEKMQPSKDLAKELVEKLSQSLELKSGKKIGILINGMGATPLMEQYVFAADVANLLADAGVEVVYKKLGNYMTSIDMAGISLTFIELDQPDWLTALNSSVTTAAW